MGRLPVLNEKNLSGDGEPAESTEDGCPGSWYRCAWTSSVMRYERMLSDSGFSENLHLSRSDDRLVLEAAAYLENQRVRAANHAELQMTKERNRRGRTQ